MAPLDTKSGSAYTQFDQRNFINYISEEQKMEKTLTLKLAQSLVSLQSPVNRLPRNSLLVS